MLDVPRERFSPLVQFLPEKLFGFFFVEVLLHEPKLVHQFHPGTQQRPNKDPAGPLDQPHPGNKKAQETHQQERAGQPKHVVQLHPKTDASNAT